MSYDITIKNKATGKTVYLKDNHNITGGMSCAGGTNEAWLNITYNYADFFREVIDPERGIRAIYGMDLKDAVELLKTSNQKLADIYTKKNFHMDPANDYWAKTPGNAAKAINDLIRLAELAIVEYPNDQLYFEGD